MQKIVAVFSDEPSINEAAKELSIHDQPDYQLVKLGDYYEQQVRPEVFLTNWQYWTTWLGALIGAALGALLFYWLAGNDQWGMLVGRLLAGGLPATLFAGAGIGFAAGGLLAGLYALAKPLPTDLRDGHMLVLYAQEPRGFKAARGIVSRHGGKLLR